MGRVRKTKRPRKHHSLGKELAGCGTTLQPRNVPSGHMLAVDSGLPAQEHTDLVVNDECGSTPPKSKAASQLESLEDSVLSSSVELKAKELARKILLQVDAVDKTINCGDIHRKPPRKFIDLDNAILSKLHFQERKNELKCLLFAFYNAVGSDAIITANEIHAQRVQWRPYREKELTNYIISNMKINNKGMCKFPCAKDLHNYLRALSNGDKSGGWTTNLLQECLVRFTNLRLKTLTPRKDYPVKEDVVQKLMVSHPIILALLEFTKHGTQQAHWVVFKNSFVHDSLLSNTYPADEFIYFEHISKMYILEYNPQVV